MSIGIRSIVGIIGYLFVIILLIRGVNKITKDSKIVMGSLYQAINEYFLTINTTIATKKNEILKFDDLISVVYAKKKRFINHKTHRLADRYELFLGIKDDIQYLGDYINQSLENRALNEQVQRYFSFLFATKPRNKVLRVLLIVLTLGVGSGFIEEDIVL